MTAWPLNCAAATAAEDVLWRRGPAAAHGLLIDTAAVPLCFDQKSEPAIAARAAPQPDEADSLARRISQMFAISAFNRR